MEICYSKVSDNLGCETKKNARKIRNNNKNNESLKVILLVVTSDLESTLYTSAPVWSNHFTWNNNPLVGAVDDEIRKENEDCELTGCSLGYTWERLNKSLVLQAHVEGNHGKTQAYFKREYQVDFVMLMRLLTRFDNG